MLSRSVSFMSQLVRNSVLFIPQICLVPKWLRLNCEGSATSSRWVRDTRDHFATILRGILSHKIFEHVQNFRDYFAPLGDTCEEITNHWRLFRDYFASHSRCLSPVVAKQSQSSEIGALERQYLLLSHRSKFKIILQNYSSWYPLLILHEWFHSDEQRPTRALDKKYF